MMAIMRGFTPEEAVRAGRALANGGARVLEVSLVDPLALRSIEQLREDLGSRYELFERAAADFLRSLGVTKGAR